MHPMSHPPSTRSPPTHIESSRPDVPPASPGVATNASRFLLSVRKSFSPPSSPRRKNNVNPPVRLPTLHAHFPSLTLPSAQRGAMYSTPEERHSRNASRAGFSRHLDSRPTIEQIAMGLHVSRTPHLRPIAGPSLPSPPPRRSLNAPVHSSRGSSDDFHDHETSTPSSQYRTHRSLPPPSRSSMKKSAPSVSTLTQSPQQCSTSKVSPSVSTNGPVSQAPSRPLSSLRVRMSKFFPSYRPLSLPSSLGRASSFTSSASDSTRPTTPRKAVRFSANVLAIEERS